MDESRIHLSPIPLMVPYIPQEALQDVAAVLTSGYLTEGQMTRRFEDAFAAFVGARHAIACPSCTAGLELVVRAMGIGAGDEVIVPDYTYPATAEAVMLAGATAVIVDCDTTTLNVDYAALEAAITPRTRALMPVSLFGNPLDWHRLEAVAHAHNLPVVEDAACGFGSFFAGKPTGSHGTCSVFSLHPRKSITTGEGGMITTSDDELAERLRSVKRFGLGELEGERENLRFVRLGGNGKMSDIVAAVGLAQLRCAPELMRRRTALARHYDELLAEALTEGRLRVPKRTDVQGWQSYSVLLPRRDSVLQAMRAKGIEVQIGTYALHREPVFRQHPLCRLQGDFRGGEQCFAQTLVLPLFHTMTDAQQERVVNELLLLC